MMLAAVESCQHVIGHRVHLSDDRIRLLVERRLLLSVKANDVLHRDIQRGKRIQFFGRIASIDTGDDDIPGHDMFSIFQIQLSVEE